MAVKAIVAMGPVLLAIYGILRIGISIGVRRATKNVVAGFLMKAELSEVTLEGKALVAQLADHDYRYNLFGPEFSHKERRKESRTRGIGATLWELVVHENRNRAHSKAGEIGSVLSARQPIDHSTRKPKPDDFHSWPRFDEPASLSTDLSDK
jgi:hypothetical protein